MKSSYFSFALQICCLQLYAGDQPRAVSPYQNKKQMRAQIQSEKIGVVGSGIVCALLGVGLVVNGFAFKGCCCLGVGSGVVCLALDDTKKKRKED